MIPAGDNAGPGLAGTDFLQSEPVLGQSATAGWATVPVMSKSHDFPSSASECATALSAIAELPGLPERVGRLSELWLGRPYLAFTLIGGPTEPEVLVDRLDGFDCVTFAESVFAVARSCSVADFGAQLTALRYDRSRVRWIDRNHYMNRWIARNVAAGHVERVLPERWIGTGEVRSLSSLPGYPAQEWPVHYFPSSDLDRLAQGAEMGDLVAFVSNRSDLDTFHVGLLVPGAPLCVRHAGRSAGQVVHEPLVDFLERNDVPGMLLARLRPIPTA